MEPLNLSSIRNFTSRFAAFKDDYVIIGGAACHVWFASRSLFFRRTSDVDIVLILRAETRRFATRRFAEALVDFFDEFGYEAEEALLDDGSRKARLYRFSNTKHADLPAQVELLGPDDDSLRHAALQRKIPVKIDGEYSGLSCMILDPDYYRLLLLSREIALGVPVLGENALVAYKIKAYLNIMEMRAAGGAHGSDTSRSNANKHRNDAIALLMAGRVAPLSIPRSIRSDIERFASLLRHDASFQSSLIASMRDTHPEYGLKEQELANLAERILELFTVPMP